jgi:predicted dehydrogenase
LFSYPEASPLARRIELKKAASPRGSENKVAVGLLGAGGFATGVLIPTMQAVAGVELVGCCSATGAHSRSAGDKFGFRYCATDEQEVLRDPAVNTVVIATRHHLHARQVLAALAAGKHVFCEKPLCLTEEELGEIVARQQRSHSRAPLLMVGFNRRFAPLAIKLKQFMDVREPLVMHYRVNAGFIPAGHWVHDPEQGGGRIRGEVCHFVDLLAYVAGSAVVAVQATPLPQGGQYSDDNAVITLRFADGSLGTVHYVANGDKSFSKERIEVFGGGAVAVLEDFRRLELVRFGKKRVIENRLTQDKGHRGEWAALAGAIMGKGSEPIPFHEIVSSTLATLRIEGSRVSGESRDVDAVGFMSQATSQAGPS